jgi:cytochrome c-type biogenesis protein CcmH/NrfG
MNSKRIFRVALLMAFVWALAPAMYAQGGGNNITGVVFGLERQPIYDVNVELLDQYSRLLQRARTDSTGRYTFTGVPPGRFTVRILPYETAYEEAEGSVELVNFVRENQMTGERSLSGFTVEQLDFHLKLRRGYQAGAASAVFLQPEIPANAKKLYDKAVDDLNNKKQTEGLAGLKAAIEAFPKYYLALSRLGEEYVKLKHYEAGRILLANAVEVNPRGYRSWYSMAYALNAMGLTPDGLTAVGRALELYPTSAEALLLSGVLLRSDKKFDRAEKDLLKAKENAKGSMPMVHWYLALLYGNDMKRYSDAARELRAFLKQQPDAKDAEMIKKLIADYEAKGRG